MNLCKHGKTESERKKYCLRPGPPYSASDFSEGDTKKGNDGNVYVINLNKKGVKQWKIRKNTESSKHPLDIKEEGFEDDSKLILTHPFVEKYIIPQLEFLDGKTIHKDDIIEFDITLDSYLSNKILTVERTSPSKYRPTLVDIKFLADPKVKKEHLPKWSQ